MTTLDLTGLPELPKGYFFRIKKWSIIGGSRYDVDVIIRRRVFRWFSVSTGCTSLADSSSNGTYHSSIQDAAGFALQRCFNERFAKRVLRRAGIETRKAFLGDYPPKKYTRNSNNA